MQIRRIVLLTCNGCAFLAGLVRVCAGRITDMRRHAYYVSESGQDKHRRQHVHIQTVRGIHSQYAITPDLTRYLQLASTVLRLLHTEPAWRRELQPLFRR